MCSRAPSLEVIDEVDEIEERDVVSPQIPASSSPCLCSLSSCSYCNTDSASFSSSRSSRTSQSEHTQESVLDRDHPSGLEDHQKNFVEDLCGRLMNISREAEITSRRVDTGRQSGFDSAFNSSLRASPLSFEKTPLSGSNVSNIPGNILQNFGLPVKRAQSELSA